jgi:hypothetical protein
MYTCWLGTRDWGACNLDTMVSYFVMHNSVEGVHTEEVAPIGILDTNLNSDR